MSIDWTRGYSARWRAFAVDPVTWADAYEIPGFDAASISREMTDDAPLLESGTMSLTAAIGQGWDEKYVRLAMVAEQDGDHERVDVCTMLCSCANGTVDRGADQLELTGMSVLYPASVALMERGAYVPKNMDGAEWAAEALMEVVQAPVHVSGSFSLSDHTVIDLGSSVLQAVWLILNAGGFTIRIDGRGEITVLKKKVNPSLELDTTRMGLLQPSVAHSLDWSAVPNRYIAVIDDDVAIAINNDANSPTSTVTRGYRSDVYDTSPTLIDGEGIQAYAERRLEELSTIPDARTYTREWWPDITVGDVVRATVPSEGIDGDMRVMRQDLTCGIGITVTEEAEMEVKAWRA